MLEFQRRDGFSKFKQVFVVFIPRRACAARVTVVVCLSVCVTANLRIHAERRQMMITNGISGVWQSFLKRRFI